jgi:hypothetical protein
MNHPTLIAGTLTVICAALLLLRSASTWRRRIALIVLQILAVAVLIATRPSSARVAQLDQQAERTKQFCSEAASIIRSFSHTLQINPHQWNIWQASHAYGTVYSLMFAAEPLCIPDMSCLEKTPHVVDFTIYNDVNIIADDLMKLSEAYHRRQSCRGLELQTVENRARLKERLP